MDAKNCYHKAMLEHKEAYWCQVSDIIEVASVNLYSTRLKVMLNFNGNTDIKNLDCYATQEKTHREMPWIYTFRYLKKYLGEEPRRDVWCEHMPQPRRPVDAAIEGTFSNATLFESSSVLDD